MKKAVENIQASKKIIRTQRHSDTLTINESSFSCEGKSLQAIVSSPESTACLEFLQLPCFVYIKYYWGQSLARLEVLSSHLYQL